MKFINSELQFVKSRNCISIKVFW